MAKTVLQDLRSTNPVVLVIMVIVVASFTVALFAPHFFGLPGPALH